MRLALCLLLAGCAGPAPALRRIIETEAAPPAIGPYSQAVQVGDTLYLSGQLGLDPATGALVSGGLEPETRKALANADAVLAAAGFRRADIVQAQVLLADMGDFAAMNKIYAEWFGTDFPARAAYQPARLPLGARIEILFTAIKGGGAAVRAFDPGR